MAKSAKILVALVLCCSLLTGCSSIFPDDVVDDVMTFDDLTISLPIYFDNMTIYDETNPVSGLFVYGYSEIIVTGLRDDKSQFEEIPTLEEYGKKLIENSEVNAEIEIIDGLVTFTYYQLNNNQSYTYFASLYEGTDSFWLVTACCQTMNFKHAKDKFLEIFHSVQVA